MEHWPAARASDTVKRIVNAPINHTFFMTLIYKNSLRLRVPNLLDFAPSASRFGRKVHKEDAEGTEITNVILTFAYANRKPDWRVRFWLWRIDSSERYRP